MPTSWYHVIPRVLSRVLIESPRSVLDVGAGFGKYGVLLRESLDIAAERYGREAWQARIDGVEAFAGYRNPIHTYVYDRMYEGAVENLLPSLDVYDVVLMADVLEHFDKEAGREVLRALMAHTRKALVVSTPALPAPQGAVNGNAFETHKSRWGVCDFAGFENDFVLADVGDNKALIVKMYPNEDVVARNKALHLRDSRLFSTPAAEPDAKLDIGFVMPHTHLTGGVKTLLGQISWLKSRGHTVRACLKTRQPLASALPEWNHPPVDGDHVLPPESRYADVLGKCDVIVAGWVDQLPELCTLGKPVLYIEQGSETFFGDLGVVSQLPDWRMRMRECYSQPCVLAGVSHVITDALENRYGRRAATLPAGMDTAAFCPGAPPEDNVILLVGNPSLAFKGFEVALRALEYAWAAGAHFSVRWVCQSKPDVRGVSYPLSFAVNPPQAVLPELYRQANMLLFTSWYEGFGMPPLEAMASGVAVVCTECGGPGEYVRSGVNALTATPGDAMALAAAVIRLCRDSELRGALAAAGRETALAYAQDSASMRRMENLLIRMHEQLGQV
jgi:glycosyltransferase involved in cell wall biosynthesis